MNSVLKYLTIHLIAVCLAFTVFGQGTRPVGKVSQKALARVDSIMRAGLAKKYYPGASIAIGNSHGMLYEACYGWQDAGDTTAVCGDDVYDLASCTKIVSSTLAFMWLYDRDKITLDARVGDILPQFTSTSITGLTMRELLTHTSGLGNISVYSLLFSNPTGKPLISYARNADYPTPVDKNAYICPGACPDPNYISAEPLEGYRRVGEACYVNPDIDRLLEQQIVKSYTASRRGRYLYSDLNFHLVKLVVEKLTGEQLDQVVAPLYARMDMNSTGYRPLEWKSASNIIPTENDILMQRGLLRGYTHDEIGAVCGNVGGNAGLFSTASDLTHFCRMMLCGGNFEGNEILLPATVKLFTTATPRAFGFNRNDDKTSPFYKGYGHTGYTGTIIWIDPSRDLYMVFLSNRVHPSRTNQGLITSALRTKLWETITK